MKLSNSRRGKLKLATKNFNKLKSFGSLGSSLLVYMLAGKGMRTASRGCRVIRADKGQLGNNKNNFKVQQYCQNETKFNGVYWRNKWPSIRDETYILKFIRIIRIYSFLMNMTKEWQENI